MAYEIVKRLENQDCYETLTRMKDAVDDNDRLRNKQHEVWESSFDWKECNSDSFINQKLDYMHNNPCKGNWNLAVSPAEYVHSSAKFYICNEHASYPVTNIGGLSDIDLTKKIS